MVNNKNNTMNSVILMLIETFFIGKNPTKLDSEINDFQAWSEPTGFSNLPAKGNFDS